MALSAGTVSISAGGTETGANTTTLAGSLYLELKKIQEVDFGVPIPSGVDGVNVKKGMAFTANRMASAIVTYFTANAKAKVATTDSGLQRTPNPNNADTNCQGPSANKFLDIV